MIASLVLAGMTRPEIAQALDLTGAAMRQRLTGLRKAALRISPSLRQDLLAAAYDRRPESGVDLDVGLIRRALIAWLRGGGGIGTHDPDGHLLVISKNPLTNRGPAATDG